MEKTGLLRLVSGLPAWFWRLLRPVSADPILRMYEREPVARKGLSDKSEAAIKTFLLVKAGDPTTQGRCIASPALWLDA